MSGNSSSTSYSYVFRPAGRRQDRYVLERESIPVGSGHNPSNDDREDARTKPFPNMNGYDRGRSPARRYTAYVQGDPSDNDHEDAALSTVSRPTRATTPANRVTSPVDSQLAPADQVPQRNSTLPTSPESTSSLGSSENSECSENSSTSSRSSNPESSGNEDRSTGAQNLSEAEGAANSTSYRVPTAQCRVCLQECIVTGLIRPCKCTGSVQYVHRECLDQWRKSSPRAYTTCNVCGFNYQFKPRPSQGILASILQLPPYVLHPVACGIGIYLFLFLFRLMFPRARLPIAVILIWTTFASLSPFFRVLYALCVAVECYSIALYLYERYSGQRRHRNAQNQGGREQRGAFLGFPGFALTFFVGQGIIDALTNALAIRGFVSLLRVRKRPAPQPTEQQWDEVVDFGASQPVL